MGDLDLILPRGNVPYTNRIEPMNWALMGSTTTATGSANDIYLYRFSVSAPTVFANGEVMYGATVAGNVAMGIMTSTDGGVNLTRLANSGIIAASGVSAVQALAFLAAYTGAPNVDYWVAFGRTDATLTVLRVAGSGVAMGRGGKCLIKVGAWDATDGIPATIATTAALNTQYAVAVTS